MKRKFLIHISMATFAIAFCSFMVRENEEVVNAASKAVPFQREECFAKFLSTLGDMEALVYIPEKNISKARQHELNVYSTDNSLEVNTKLLKSGAAYIMVNPDKNITTECGKSISVNFDELEMTVFVKKDNIRKLEEQFEMKWIAGKSASSEMIRWNGKSSENFQIKIEGRGLTNYVPVELK